MEAPNYQSRVKKRILDEPQDKLELPTQPAADKASEDLEEKGGHWSAWLMALITGILAFISFSVVEAVLFVTDMFTTSWFLASVLTLFLLAFVIAILVLIWQEWSGYLTLKKVSKNPALSLTELKSKGDKSTTLGVLEKRQKLHVGSPFSRQLYSSFHNTIQDHHTNDEVLDIYQDQVVQPTLEKAKKVLRKESISAGTIGLVSPNSMIQTFGILWVSLRTLRRIALVFGIRPSVNGNLKLFRIALENLAASSITDLITDEIANQLGGQLVDKVLVNSADAAIALALNERLGKSLIKYLTINLD
jgi:putative membrane protein